MVGTASYVMQLTQFVIARGSSRYAPEQRTLVATSLRELLPVDALAMPRGKSWGDQFAASAHVPAYSRARASKSWNGRSTMNRRTPRALECLHVEKD